MAFAKLPNTEHIELKELNYNLIEHFVNEDNLTGLQEIFNAKDSDINILNEDLQTPLHLACELGKVSFVEFLISKGADVTAKDHNEFSPLITACREGNLACVKMICDCPQPVLEQIDKNGWSGLMWAVYKGHTNVVEFLLNEGANVHITVCYNMTSLLWAAARGFHSIVRLLCSKGAKVNNVDKFGNTSLIWATRYGYSNVVECLLEYNADPNIVGANGCISLINAVKANHKECVSALINSSHVNVNQTDRSGHTALCYAAKQGAVEITSMLLERGAYLNLADFHGDTPLIKAVKYGHLETVRILLSHFADVDTEGKDGKTALHLTCELGYTDIMRELLNCGCKVECRNSNHETPLLRAVKEGNIFITKLLLSHGADVSAQDHNHDTCIHHAIRSQNLSLAELLLRNPKHGRYLYQENRFGDTPYDIDTRNHKKILSQLFGSKGFSTASINNDPYFDMPSCSLAEMLADPMLEPPLCVGLFAKWGSNVEFLLNKIKYQIELFACSLPPVAHKLSWFTFLVIFYISAVFGTLMAFLFYHRMLAGILSSSMLLCSAYFAIWLIHFGSRFGHWNWARAACHKIQEAEKYIRLLMKICFLSHHEQPIGGKVRYTFAGCINISSLKEKSLIGSLSAALVGAAERSVGKAAFRLARALPTSALPDDQMCVFRSFCCIPTFVYALLWFPGLAVVLLMLVAVYGPTPLVPYPSPTYYQLIVIICVISIILGCILIVSIPTLYKVVFSCFRSPQKVQKSAGCDIHSNTVEINKMSRAMSLVDSINLTNTRICLLINALESSNKEQLVLLIKAIRSVFSTSPIIIVICVDYNVLALSVEKYPFSFIDIEKKEHDFIRHIIQLPIFLSDKKNRKKSFKSMEESESDPDAELVEVNRNSRRRYPKQFDVTKWLANDECFQPVDPLIIKRVASIISYTARLLRGGGKDFSWNSLSSWIVLTELWSYSTTSMLCYIIKKRDNPSKPLKTLYNEIYYSISTSRDIGDAAALQKFLSSKSCLLTVGDVVMFYQFTVNLDPSLEDSAPMFTESWTLPTRTYDSRHASTVMSSVSNASYDDIPLCDWSVEEVCRKIKSIPGLNSGNLQRYDTFIRNNNLHGLALSLCEVDELKKELHTSFGDWCLIRAFIHEVKMTTSKTKAVSSSSLTSSGNRKVETASNHKLQAGDEAQQFSSLSAPDRLAYGQAFKEYLKLQPHSSPNHQGCLPNHDDTQSVTVHSQLDNERHPLLSNLDINANA